MEITVLSANNFRPALLVNLPIKEVIQRKILLGNNRARAQKKRNPHDVACTHQKNMMALIESLRYSNSVHN